METLESKTQQQQEVQEASESRPGWRKEEEEALHELDRELDERLRRLCRPQCRPRPRPRPAHPSSSSVVRRTKPPKTPRQPDTHGTVVFSVTNGAVECTDTAGVETGHHTAAGASCPVEGHPLSSTQGNEHLQNPGILPFFGQTETEGLPQLPVASGSNEEEVQQEEQEQEEEEEELKQDAIFDEFLEATTLSRIKVLTQRVTSLSATLRLSQEECKKLAAEKREARQERQGAEAERRSVGRQVQGLRQEVARLNKANTHLHQRLTQLTEHNQELRKECGARRGTTGEGRGAGGTTTTQASLQARLTRLAADNNSLRAQLAALTTRHKEEREQLRAQEASSCTKVHQLQRENKTLASLVKKQEHLISVLSQQKSNIAAAKVVAGLQKKYLEVVSPLQPP